MCGAGEQRWHGGGPASPPGTRSRRSALPPAGSCPRADGDVRPAGRVLPHLSLRSRAPLTSRGPPPCETCRRDVLQQVPQEGAPGRSLGGRWWWWWWWERGGSVGLLSGVVRMGARCPSPWDAEELREHHRGAWGNWEDWELAGSSAGWALGSASLWFGERQRRRGGPHPALCSPCPPCSPVRGSPDPTLPAPRTTGTSRRGSASPGEAGITGTR